MRAQTAVALAYAGLCAHAQVYVLDTTWPGMPASFNVSRITSVAIANGTTNTKEVHIAQRGLDAPPVIVLDTSGNLLRTWGEGDVDSIHGMQTQSGQPSLVWVTDIAAGAVKAFNVTGGLLKTFGTPGQPGGGVDPVQFSAPADIAFTPAGHVVVSDGDGGDNNRVLDLLPTGSVAWGVGGAGSGPGQFSSPHSVAYEPTWQRIWVVDRGNARLQVFLGDSGLWVGDVSECFAPGIPWGIRIDARRNRIILADGTNGRLYALDMTWGASQYDLGSCHLSSNVSVGVSVTPHELALDDDTGDVYLAGVGNATAILRFKLSA